ncbi:hypothetical protein P9112_001362 [Eukaryota sp. TZLM1-RC]
MRCFLWPCSVPNDLICRCGQFINLNHLFNCKFNITYRSVVHDAVRDQLYAMCKSHHIEAFVEPLVRRLSSENEDENTFGKRHADLITPASDGVIKVVDVVTVDVCKDSAIDFAKRDETPLCFAEKSKIKKYNEPLSQLGRVEHVKYQLVPFAVSLFGNIGISGIKFLKDFRSLIKERAGKEFPDVHITAYMDDISIIGPIDSLRTIAEIVQQRYYQIGLSLNISKCLLIGREPADLIIDDQSVPFINYFESGFRFFRLLFRQF